MVDAVTAMTLIDKLSALTGPDREVDGLIAAAINACQLRDGYLYVWSAEGSTETLYRPLHYTASIDAAMTLVPEGCDSGGTEWNVEKWTTNGVHAEHIRATAWVAGARRAYAATPAIALCIAALKARNIT